MEAMLETSMNSGAAVRKVSQRWQKLTAPLIVSVIGCSVTLKPSISYLSASSEIDFRVHVRQNGPILSRT